MEKEMELLYKRLLNKVLETEQKINKNNKNTDDYVSGLANGTVVGMNTMLKFLQEELENVNYDA